MSIEKLSAFCCVTLCLYLSYHVIVSWEHKVRGQGHKKKPRPRPRTALPRTDPHEAKDSNARGHGPRRKCSPKKRSSRKIFRRSPNETKKRSSKFFFRRSPKKRNLRKEICQAISKEENKTDLRKFSAIFLAFSNKILTVQKLVLSSSRGQRNFQGLKASRPRPKTWSSRPRTSKCVFEDSTSAS